MLLVQKYRTVNTEWKRVQDQLKEIQGQLELEKEAAQYYITLLNKIGAIDLCMYTTLLKVVGVRWKNLIPDLLQTGFVRFLKC